MWPELIRMTSLTTKCVVVIVFVVIVLSEVSLIGMQTSPEDRKKYVSFSSRMKDRPER